MSEPLTRATCTEDSLVYWSPSGQWLKNLNKCPDALKECLDGGSPEDRCLTELSEGQDLYESISEQKWPSIVCDEPNGILAKTYKITGKEFPKGTPVCHTSGDVDIVYLPFDKEEAESWIFLAKDQNIKGTKFAKGVMLAFVGDDTIKGVMLGFAGDYPTKVIVPTDQEIGGIKCAKDELIELCNNGKVAEATLSETQEIDGVVLKKGTRIYLDGGGELEKYVVTFPNDQKIQELDIASGGVSYYKSGKLYEAKLAKDQKLDGVDLPDGTDVVLSEEGKLKSIALTADHKIQDILFPKESRIDFAAGKVWEVHIPVDWELQGVKFPANAVVKFYEYGKIYSANIAGTVFFYNGDGSKATFVKLLEEEWIGEFRFGEGTFVTFNEKGNLKTVTLFERTELEGINFAPFSQLVFGENGKIESAVLGLGDGETVGEYYKVGSMRLPDGKIYTFITSDGHLIRSVPKETTAIDGTAFNYGTKVKFDEHGNLKSATLSGDQMIGGKLLYPTGSTVEFPIEVIEDASGEKTRQLDLMNHLIERKKIQNALGLLFEIDYQTVHDNYDLLGMNIGLNIPLGGRFFIVPKLAIKVAFETFKEGTPYWGYDEKTGEPALKHSPMGKGAAIFVPAAFDIGLLAFRGFGSTAALKLKNWLGGLSKEDDTFWDETIASTGGGFEFSVFPERVKNLSAVSLYLGGGALCNITKGDCEPMLESALGIKF